MPKTIPSTTQRTWTPVSILETYLGQHSLSSASAGTLTVPRLQVPFAAPMLSPVSFAVTDC